MHRCLYTDVSVKGNCEEADTNNRADFNLNLKKGWNFDLRLQSL